MSNDGPDKPPKDTFMQKYRTFWSTASGFSDSGTVRAAIKDALKHGDKDTAMEILDAVARERARSESTIGGLKTREASGETRALTLEDKGKIYDTEELVRDMGIDDFSEVANLMTMEEVDQVLAFIKGEDDAVREKKADMICDMAMDIASPLPKGDFSTRKHFTVVRGANGAKQTVTKLSKHFHPKNSIVERRAAQDLVDKSLEAEHSELARHNILSRAAMRGASSDDFAEGETSWDFKADNDGVEAFDLPGPEYADALEEGSMVDAVYTVSDRKVFAELIGAPETDELGEGTLLGKYIDEEISPNWHKDPKLALLEGVGVLTTIASDPEKYKVVSNIIADDDGKIRSDEDRKYLIAEAEFDGLMEYIMKVMNMAKTSSWRHPKKRLENVEAIGEAIRSDETFDEQRKQDILRKQAELIDEIDNLIEGSSRFKYKVEITKDVTAPDGTVETETKKENRWWTRYGGLQEVIRLNDERDKNNKDGGGNTPPLMLDTSEKPDDVEK
ncbi:MAG: hypothetical protein LBL08_00770 [Candidatus Nomurabacteria bacterium]|jgi:hypothetical protein|nr:hypothetical protein [Candidatus Nomurabacteria bacterium]